MENEIIIKSKTESLQLVEKFVDNFSASHNISKDVYGNLLITALEATNNAITHGNKLIECKDVYFALNIREDEIEMIVKDQGPGFDYKTLPDPTSPENLENMSGRGVFLMTRLSDKIEFENNGSHIKMVFYLK